MKSSIEREINNKGHIIYKSKGQSMLPLIREGKDIIVIKKAPAKCNKRDIVLFKVDSKYILHRLVFVGEDFYVTKGDNCFKKDNKIYKENILGVLVSIERNGKTLSMNSKLMKFYGWICADCYVLWNVIIFIKRANKKLWRIFKSVKKKNGK